MCEQFWGGSKNVHFFVNILEDGVKKFTKFYLHFCEQFCVDSKIVHNYIGVFQKTDKRPDGNQNCVL